MKKSIQIKRYCSKHKRKYSKTCYYCQIEKRYKKGLRIFLKNNNFDDIRRLAVHNRRKDRMIERLLLIKLLRDKFKLSFNKIAQLLDRDRSTIIYYYYK